MRRALLLALAVLAAAPAGALAAPAHAAKPIALGRLASGATATLVPGAHGWGIAVGGAGQASAVQPRPVAVQITASATAPVHVIETGYDTVRRVPGGFVGRTRVAFCSCAALAVVDSWRLTGDSLVLARRTTVRGTARGGFATGVRLQSLAAAPRSALREFLPAEIYGGTGGIVPLAIGGSTTYAPGQTGIAEVREDELPAPLFGVQFPDGTSMTVSDPAPDGRSTAADTQDKAIHTVIDAGIHVQSLETLQQGDRVSAGTWAPATEGQSTFAGGGFDRPLVATFRRRFHPLRRGFVQKLRAEFRFRPAQDERSFRRDAWNHAYAELHPVVPVQDQTLARETLVQMLFDRATTTDGRTGISLIWNAVTGKPNAAPGTGPALMGFVGDNLTAASLLIRDSLAHPGPQATARIALAGRIADSFTLLPMNPPVGEGFDLATGAPAFYPNDGVVHLRPLADDAESLLEAVVLAKQAGLDPEAGTLEDPQRALQRAMDGRPARGPDGWLAWLREFGDFLVSQQQPDGTIPRSWKAGTTQALDLSPVSSELPVPFLLHLSDVTGDPKYAAAAVRAGERQWAAAQSDGFLSGAITDTVGVDADGKKEAAIDSESTWLSLKAYLALYQATQDPRWLDRATAAAEASESFLVIWRIPSATGIPESQLQFKPSASPIGMNLTSASNNFLDQATGFAVEDFMQLATLTGDSHWDDVAKLVLNGGKAMLALPGRQYDLAGPGWQQEGTYLGTPRGRGLNRSWLPWIASSQLHSTLLAEATDPAEFAKLSAP